MTPETGTPTFPKHTWLDGNLVVLASDCISYGEECAARAAGDLVDESTPEKMAETAKHLHDKIERVLSLFYDTGMVDGQSNAEGYAAAHAAQAVADERARVVVWLQTRANFTWEAASAPHQYAAAIERGEHVSD